MELSFRCSSHTIQNILIISKKNHHHHIHKHPHKKTETSHYLKKKETQYFHKHPLNFTNIHILFINIVINIISIIFPFFQSPSPFWAVWGGSQLARVLDFVFIDTEHIPLDRKV